MPLGKQRVNRDWLTLVNERHPPASPEARAHVRDWLTQGKVFVRVPGEVLEEVVSSGQLMNQHESGQSEGMLHPGLRLAAEAALHALPLDAPAGERPIYGYMQEDDGGGVYARGEQNERLAQYGNVAVELKASVRDRVTVTLGDSLDASGVVVLDPATRETRSAWALAKGYSELDVRRALAHTLATVSPRAPAPLTAPTDDELDGLLDGDGDAVLGYDAPDDLNGYVEAQVHGGIALADVEAVHLPGSRDDEADFFDDVDEDVLDALEAAGVRVVWHGV